MKKWVSRLITVLLLLSLTLTAVSCGGKDRTPEPAPEPAPAGEPGKEEGPGREKTPPETDAAAPLLWRVTDGEGHALYLFGTIHVGDERNDAVLERIAPVLESCDALAVEFDVVAYAGNMQQMMTDMRQYLLTDGSVVSDYMPEDLYQRSYELLERAKMMPAVFTHYNLAWWMQMVESAMLEVCTGLDGQKAMDSLLIRRAYEKEMPVLEVESSGFQMALFNSFDPALCLLVIENTLENEETYNSDLNELYTLWLSGDRDGLWSYLETENEEPGDYTAEQLALIEDYYRRLLDERNYGMRDRAIEYLASGRTVFFAVGSAHMANETGLVQLLTDAGYAVEAIAY